MAAVPVGGGDGPQMVVMEGGNAQYRLDLFVNIQNAFNNVNYNAFIGNQLSSFFGTPTSARRRAASSSDSHSDSDEILNHEVTNDEGIAESVRRHSFCHSSFVFVSSA